MPTVAELSFILLNEKGRNAGLAGDRSTVSGKHTRAFNGHSTDRLSHTTKTTSQNGDYKSLYIHALKMWFRNYYVAYAFVWCV